MKRGFTLIELMIVIAIIAVIAAVAIPGLLAAQRAAGERNASASLKTLATAEADFRSNDRDGNLVNDYWTADVHALYALIPAVGTSTTVPGDVAVTDNIIALIEPSLAGADGLTQQALYGNLEFDDGIGTGSPKSSYVYRAFGRISNGTESSVLAIDTDGNNRYYGLAHNYANFAFAAFPVSIGSGKLIFVMNQNNTIWKYNLGSGYAATFKGASGASADSESTCSGTGRTDVARCDFDFTEAIDSSTFPGSPASFGCSKLD
jgi:prepilin-type N-terminal cleavage/methylation domain-containing protein